jgi:hypothetical protein
MQNMSQKLNAHFLSDILDCFNAIFKFQNGYISIHICFDLTGTTTIEFVAIFCMRKKDEDVSPVRRDTANLMSLGIVRRGNSLGLMVSDFNPPNNILAKCAENVSHSRKVASKLLEFHRGKLEELVGLEKQDVGYQSRKNLLSANYETNQKANKFVVKQNAV